jgi:hypothetical protein
MFLVTCGASHCHVRLSQFVSTLCAAFEIDK